MTLDKLILECENYSHSREHYELMKEAYELNLLSKFTNDKKYYSKTSNDTETKKDINELEKKLEEKKLNFLQKIIQKISEWFKKIIDTITKADQKYKNINSDQVSKSLKKKLSIEHIKFLNEIGEKYYNTGFPSIYDKIEIPKEYKKEFLGKESNMMLFLFIYNDKPIEITNGDKKLDLPNIALILAFLEDLSKYLKGDIKFDSLKKYENMNLLSPTYFYTDSEMINKLISSIQTNLTSAPDIRKKLQSGELELEAKQIEILEQIHAKFASALSKFLPIYQKLSDQKYNFLIEVQKIIDNKDILKESFELNPIQINKSKNIDNLITLNI